MKGGPIGMKSSFADISDMLPLYHRQQLAGIIDSINDIGIGIA
jgi:hypothetical protein